MKHNTYLLHGFYTLTRNVTTRRQLPETETTAFSTQHEEHQMARITIQKTELGSSLKLRASTHAGLSQLSHLHDLEQTGSGQTGRHGLHTNNTQDDTSMAICALSLS